MRVLLAAASLVVVGAAVAGCGSRGPLDVGVVEEAADAGGTTPGAVDSGGGTTEDAGHRPKDAATADAPHEAGLLACGTCVAQSCGTQILTCLTDTTCRTELQCIATQCLAGADGGGGGLGNLGCFGSCAGNNPASLASLLGIIQCITTSCGTDCGGVLGGLGGLGGKAGAQSTGAELFSAYPEICGPL